MCLLRYEEDSRFIPVTGKSNGVTTISSESHFSIQNQNVILHDPKNENVPLNIGSTMQYTVTLNGNEK